MSALRDAARQALEALDAGVSVSPKSVLHDRLRAALAQEELEPSVRIKCTVVDNQHPSGVPFEQWVNAPRREWRELTEEEIRAAYGKDLKYRDGDYERFARAIEAALKEKNA